MQFHNGVGSIIMLPSPNFNGGGTTLHQFTDKEAKVYVEFFKSNYLQDLMGPLHIQPTQILALNLHKLRPPPPLMDPIHNPFRNPGLADLQRLVQPNSNTPQPLQLLPRNQQLRQHRQLLLLLLLHSSPAIVLPLPP